MRVVGVSSVLFGSLLALSLVRCGSDSGSGSGGAANFKALLGTWSCDIKTAVKITTPTGTPDQNLTSTTSLDVTKTGDAQVTIQEEDDPTCALELNVSGTTGSLKSSFTCDQGGLTLKVTSAKLTASGDKLTGTRTASVSGMTDQGAAISGSAVTTITCTKTSGPTGDDGGTGQGTGGASGAGGKAGTGGSTSGTDCSTASSCEDCCSSANSAGSDSLDNLLLDCACKACATQCASSLCNADPSAPVTGDACDTCAGNALSDTGSCIQPAASSCRADTACSAYATCLAACP